MSEPKLCPICNGAGVITTTNGYQGTCTVAGPLRQLVQAEKEVERLAPQLEGSLRQIARDREEIGRLRRGIESLGREWRERGKQYCLDMNGYAGAATYECADQLARLTDTNTTPSRSGGE